MARSRLQADSVVGWKSTLDLPELQNLNVKDLQNGGFIVMTDYLQIRGNALNRPFTTNDHMVQSAMLEGNLIIIPALGR